MTQLKAWILPLSENLSVALGHAELKYLEQIDKPVAAPGLPAHCKQGFLWRGQLIPILDLCQWVNPQRPPITDEQLVAIVAYQPKAGQELQLGALSLSAVPKLVEVDPDEAQPAENLPMPWRTLAHAAFQQGQNHYPVLNLSGLFSPNDGPLTPSSPG